MKKKILFNLSFSLWPIFNYELDLIQQKLDEGHVVKILYCNSSPEFCEANLEKILRYKKLNFVCNYCLSKFKDGLSWLNNKDNLLIENFDYVTADQKKIILNYENILTKKDNVDDEIMLFLNKISKNILDTTRSNIITTIESSLSSYKNKENFLLFKKISKSTLSSYFSSLNHMKKFRPDEVYIYNGRIYRYQPMMRIAQSTMLKDNINVYEWPTFGNLNLSYSKGSYGHNSGNHSRQVFEASQKDNTDFLKREAFSKKLLEKNINKKNLPWENKQIKGSLPKNFSKSNFNITYFTSSEFEYLGIPEIEKNFKFKNNLGAIKSILKCINEKPSTFLNIRMHPQGGLDSDTYFKEFQKLKKYYSNFQIIEPNSTVDSHELMKKSDLIIVIHSTAGLEASYLNKNVINLGMTTWSSFEISKRCFDEKELHSQLNKCIDKNNFEDFPSENTKYQSIINYVYSYYNFGFKSKFLKERKKNKFHIFKMFKVNMIRNGKTYSLKAKFFERYFYYTYYILTHSIKKIFKF